MIIKPCATNVYPYLVRLIAPRPIAWVSTLSAADRVNLTPFSFFNVFGDDPPIVIVAPVLKPDGQKKDTLRNVEVVPEFVLNIVNRDLAESANVTSLPLPYGESEADRANLTMVPSQLVRPPRVEAAAAHLECRVRQLMPIGTSTLIIGEVVLIDVNDAVLDAQGMPDPRKLKLVGRMGGDFWCETTQLFELKRPTLPPPD